MLLMKTLFPEPRTISQARRQANIVERALDLLTSGYTFRAVPHHEGLYSVVNPEGTRYMVDLKLERCSCKSFEYDRDCKHRIAMQLKEDEDEWADREAAAAAAMEADADEPLGIERG
jgi:SWIM zinc finger